MFYSLQKKQNKEKYQELLKLVGSLSNLFSDSTTPFLHYRVAEKLFCEAFDAEDLSRSDISADAKKSDLGIGLKTFLSSNNKTFQKVAEFNSDRLFYADLGDTDLIYKIAELRNRRIEFTEKAHGLSSSIYHCVVRDSNKFRIFENKMSKINITDIQAVKRSNNSIKFDDGVSEYSFLLSKSTLTMRFETSIIEDEFYVEILDNPLEDLKRLFDNSNISTNSKMQYKAVYLPLYSYKKKKVGEKSGLNQWNACGRKRHSDEVYIPIPAKIHKKFPDFFPERDEFFTLKFPDGEEVKSSVCQDGSKALMTKPNKKLGKLILRDGLNLAEGELATYEKLQLLGVDSVRIDKIKDDYYEINFAKNGSFEDFYLNYL